MIESLIHFKIPVEWHHVGDGIERTKLEDLIAKYGVKDKFIFHGMKDSRDVLDFYSDNTFDVFINVSSSEGVPISIMEAFSAGIPVFATDVGGTSEIVDETVGGLLDENISGFELAQRLTKFYQLNNHIKLQMRAKAFERYDHFCNAEKLAKELGEFLIS